MYRNRLPLNSGRPLWLNFKVTLESSIRSLPHGAHLCFALFNEKGHISVMKYLFYRGFWKAGNHIITCREEGKKTEVRSFKTAWNKWAALDMAVIFFTALAKIYHFEIMCLWGVGMGLWVHCLRSPGGGAVIPWVGITSGCELLYVSARKQTPDHYRKECPLSSSRNLHVT